ncbi:MAG: hypothetical protein RLZZ502_1474, partial [Pseudomonadota bacterium]
QLVKRYVRKAFEQEILKQQNRQ